MTGYDHQDSNEAKCVQPYDMRTRGSSVIHDKIIFFIQDVKVSNLIRFYKTEGYPRLYSEGTIPVCFVNALRNVLME